MMLMAELQNVGDTYYRYIWVGILEGQGKSLLVEDSWKSKRKYKMEIQKYKLIGLPVGDSWSANAMPPLSQSATNFLNL